jgi:hypothetical protein
VGVVRMVAAALISPITARRSHRICIFSEILLVVYALVVSGRSWGFPPIQTDDTRTLPAIQTAIPAYSFGSFWPFFTNESWSPEWWNA